MDYHRSQRDRLFALFVLTALVTTSAAFSRTGPAPTPSQAPSPALSQPQPPAGDEQVWKEFIAWFKKAPADADAFRLYGEEL
ncbi:MAG: hypothetical protein EHM31_06410, partial [Candidatus Aminicenantes bacterium]